jgi:hypothetical protein
MKVLVTLVLVLLLAGCAAREGGAGSTIAEEETTVLKRGGDLRRPPDSTLSYGGREVKGRLGSYCWTSMCADMAGIPVPRKQQTLTVPSGSEMVFRYGGQSSPYEVKSVNGYPLDKVKGVNGYPLDKKSPSTASADPNLSRPLKAHGSGVERAIPAELPPGEYAVEVFVVEPQGDAVYSFRVLVE